MATSLLLIPLGSMWAQEQQTQNLSWGSSLSYWPSGGADAATLRLGELIVPTEPMGHVSRAPVWWLGALCWGVKRHIAIDKSRALISSLLWLP